MPIDRGAIDEQLREIGEGERWWDHREFRDLPHILNGDERLAALVVGAILGPRRPRLPRLSSWLIVVTDQRVVCLQRERYGRKQVDILNDQITGIQYGRRLRGFRVSIQTVQRRYRLRIPRSDAYRFVSALSALAPRPGNRLPAPEPPLPAWPAGETPGWSTVSGFVARVAMMPPADAATRADLVRLENTVERLERDVERLQQQVEFLERLLQSRTEATGVISIPETVAAGQPRIDSQY